MNKAFDKILERLEENQTIVFNLGGGKPKQSIDYTKAVEIVQEVAEEYEDGWIPCSEMLPEDGIPVLLQDSEGYYSLGVSESKRNIKGFRDGDWWGSANNYKAWQPLPEPYKEKD